MCYITESSPYFCFICFTGVSSHSTVFFFYCLLHFLFLFFSYEEEFSWDAISCDTPTTENIASVKLCFSFMLFSFHIHIFVSLVHLLLSFQSLKSLLDLCNIFFHLNFRL